MQVQVRRWGTPVGDAVTADPAAKHNNNVKNKNNNRRGRKAKARKPDNDDGEEEEEEEDTVPPPSLAQQAIREFLRAAEEQSRRRAASSSPSASSRHLAYAGGAGVDRGNGVLNTYSTHHLQQRHSFLGQFRSKRTLRRLYRGERVQDFRNDASFGPGSQIAPDLPQLQHTHSISVAGTFPPSFSQRSASAHFIRQHHQQRSDRDPASSSQQPQQQPLGVTPSLANSLLMALEGHVPLPDILADIEEGSDADLVLLPPGASGKFAAGAGAGSTRLGFDFGASGKSLGSGSPTAAPATLTATSAPVGLSAKSSTTSSRMDMGMRMGVGRLPRTPMRRAELHPYGSGGPRSGTTSGDNAGPSTAVGSTRANSRGSTRANSRGRRPRPQPRPGQLLLQRSPTRSPPPNRGVPTAKGGTPKQL